MGDAGWDSSFMKCIDGAVDGDQGSVVRRGDPSTQSLEGREEANVWGGDRKVATLH